MKQREHTIQTLNSKVSELQKVVARVLKEKGGQSGTANSSLVNIKAWLSSSPKRADEVRRYICALILQFYLIAGVFSAPKAEQQMPQSVMKARQWRHQMERVM